MKIISRGTPPELQNYRTNCNKCHSFLEFQKSDARVVDDRNETVYVITCPVCSCDIWISSQALKPVQENINKVQ
ncbi:hypothetical protein APB94_17510 [Acinetobacter lactucae]|nr:hypothetical protein APB94_17510 [Acinetobacter lactucae]